MRIKYIKAAIVSLIRPICKNTFFNRSSAVYPHIRLELKRLKTPPPCLQFILYIDYKAKLEKADELEELADKVQETFSGLMYKNDKIIMTAHPEQGEQSEVPDTAADLKRISAYIPLRVYFRKE